MKRPLIALIATIAFTQTAAAAQSSWRPVATASGSFPSASVDLGKSNGLAVRAYGTNLEVSAHFSCDLPENLKVASGQVVALNIARAVSCLVTVTANHADFSGGRVRVQILKR